MKRQKKRSEEKNFMSTEKFKIKNISVPPEYEGLFLLLENVTTNYLDICR